LVPLFKSPFKTGRQTFEPETGSTFFVQTNPILAGYSSFREDVSLPVFFRTFAHYFNILPVPI
jgi:hypothetical protein